MAVTEPCVITIDFRRAHAIRQAVSQRAQHLGCGPHQVRAAVEAATAALAAGGNTQQAVHDGYRRAAQLVALSGRGGAA